MADDVVERAAMAMLDAMEPHMRARDPDTFPKTGWREYRDEHPEQWARDWPLILIGARAAIDAMRQSLAEHIAEQITHAETRIQDGKEMGATVWRIALEDIVRENRALLASLTPSPDHPNPPIGAKL